MKKRPKKPQPKLRGVCYDNIGAPMYEETRTKRWRDFIIY